MKKKFLSLALVLALAVTTVGCNSKTEESSNTDKSANSEVSADDASEESTEVASEESTGAESPFTAENPGTLTVAVYDRSNMDSDYGTVVDNYWVNWIKESVSEELNINVEFVAVPRSGAETTMTTMLAGQNAPDIIFYYDYDTVADFINQGGLADLTEAVELYGDNLKEQLADVLEYGVYDGKQYAIPAKRGDTGHLCSFIRKDWLDKIGYELEMDENGVGYISTTDLEYVLTTWKEQGIAEYPMGLAYESGSEAESMSPIYLAFMNEEISDEDLAVYPDFMWDGVKDGFAYMNKLYNAGLIQPDWAQYTSDETQFNNWIATGQVGFWAHAAWQGISDTGFGATLMENDAEAVITPVCVTNDNGVAARVDQYTPYGMMIVVPAYSEHVTEAVMYLNWQADWDNYETLAYGFEGEHYNLNEDGSHESFTNDTQEKRISTGDLILVFNGNPDSDIYQKELIGPTMPERLVETRMAGYYAAHVNTYTPHLWREAIQSVGEYSSSLGEKLAEIRVKTITCATEDFESTWETLSNEYLEMGGQTVIDDKRAVYEAE